jgi:hypothetical protein
MNDTSHFQQFLNVAASQAEPHRLLFVFAAAELPDNATPVQRERFAAGEGGALAPLMCVDKAPADLADFNSLVLESRRAGPPWHVVFAAALPGIDRTAPPPGQIEAALQSMVEAVRTGAVGRLAAYSLSGDLIVFS